ncbi:MAG: DUF3800 domain-containing protein [Methanosarcinales archaeon Met12]|nr:MAG: DUF3800 domain-containing protein [Methanosarcinales archaeon Met12]
MKIYLDESGDLGFGSRASKYFVLAALLVRSPPQIKKCFTKVRRQKLPKKYKKTPELKFHNSSPTIKRRLLERIADTDTDIVYAVLRKHQVHKSLRDKQPIIYNYVSGSLLSKIVTEYRLKGTVNVFVDKSLYGLQRESFDQYLTWRALMSDHTRELDIKPPKIVHADSQQDPCIQAADFVAGAIHCKYRDKKDVYYQKIKSRVSIALDFFEGKSKNYVVNPSLLRPTRLRAASSFSKRTYSPITSIQLVRLKTFVGLQKVLTCQS